MTASEFLKLYYSLIGEGTLSGDVSGSGVAGQVAFWTDTYQISGSNNLTWDNTNSIFDVNGYISLSAQSKPTLDTDRGFLYTKVDGGGNIELWYMDNFNALGGRETQIVNDGHLAGDSRYAQLNAYNIYPGFFGASCP